MFKDFAPSMSRVTEAFTDCRIVNQWRLAHPTDPISAAFPQQETSADQFTPLERAVMHVINPSRITPILEDDNFDLKLYYELIRGQSPQVT